MIDMIKNALSFGGSQPSTPAPVVDAVGQTPQEAIVAGGGLASEANTISPEGAMSDTMKRMGNVVSGMGQSLMAGSSAQPRQAPSFKPKFSPIQTPAFGADVAAQLGTQDYTMQL